MLVIPGRKRYHVRGCRQLAGRDHEELTYEEAREEGFTPCTACLPDAALGGRQLPPADDSAPAVPAESLADPSEPTRDLRPPVLPPEPATPAQESAASPAEAGWFGRTTEDAPPPAGKGEPSAAAPEPEGSRPGAPPPPSRPARSSSAAARPEVVLLVRPRRAARPEVVLLVRLRRAARPGRTVRSATTRSPGAVPGPRTSRVVRRRNPAPRRKGPVVVPRARAGRPRSRASVRTRLPHGRTSRTPGLTPARNPA
ncbi:hypothetical protein ACFSTC_35215 [Nonomuraea ferruginea]